MTKLLAVGLGSAVGGMARYLAGLGIVARGGFPLATFCINILGSFLIGLFSGLIVRFTSGTTAEILRLGLVVGVCGGFTTFSTFSNETLRLITSSQYLTAAIYVGASVLAGIAAVGVGLKVGG